MCDRTLKAPRSFYAGLSVTCVAIAFRTVVGFCGRDVVRVYDAESEIAGNDNEGKNKKGGRKDRPPFFTAV